MEGLITALALAGCACLFFLPSSAAVVPGGILFGIVALLSGIQWARLAFIYRSDRRPRLHKHRPTSTGTDGQVISKDAS